MYCVKCGVELADSENKCPLCNTEVYHPVVKQINKKPLYPSGILPRKPSIPRNLNGALVVLFLVPMIVCFIADLQINGEINWFGFVCGALLLSYISLALPLWFLKPNPVVFTPCSIVATILYLFYINLAVEGTWFFSFAFPVVGGVGIIVCAVVSLLRYLKRGRLYIFGGAFILLGVFVLLIEYLMTITFTINFIGWSIYPLIVMVALGGLLIFFSINNQAREIMERKLFF